MNATEWQGELRQGLERLKSAVERESSLLELVPERAFPQLYNRLQGTGGIPRVLAKSLDAGRRRFSRPWLQLMTPIPQSRALLAMLRGHVGDAVGCDFSPDGKRLATADYAGDLNIWDVGTYAQVAEVRSVNPESPIRFSRDGRWLYAANKGEGIARLDWQHGGSTVLCPAAEGIERRTLALSPDGRKLAFVGNDGVIRLLTISAESDEAQRLVDPPYDLAGAGSAALCLAFSADGQLLASGHKSGTIVAQEVSTGRIVRMFQQEGATPRFCLFQPHGGTFVVGTSQELRVFDRIAGAPNLTLPCPDYAFCGAFSPDGAYLAVGGSRRLTIWDTRSWSQAASLLAHGDMITSCAFSPDGLFIASGCWDGHFALWSTGEALAAGIERSAGHERTVSGCVFSPDGKTIFTSGMDGFIRTWSGWTGLAQETLAGRGGGENAPWNRCIAIAPDGKRLATGSAGDDCRVRLWDAATGEELSCLAGHGDRVNACVFSPDGLLLASASNDRTVRVWHVPSGRELAVLDIRAPSPFDYVYDCAFSPDGGTLICCSGDKTIRQWSVAGDPERGEWSFQDRGAMLRHSSCILTCSFHPNGKEVIFSDETGLIGVVDPLSGSMVRSAQAHKNPCTACWFSPDGRLVVSAVRNDDLLRLSAAGSLRMMALTAGFTGGVTCCAFSPDNRTIAAGGALGGLALFRIQWGSPLYWHQGWGPAAPGWKFQCPACAYVEWSAREARVTEATCPRCGERSLRPGELREYVSFIRETIAAERWSDLQPAERRIPLETLWLIQADLAQRHGMIPLLRVESTLYVATAAPVEPTVTDEIQFFSGCAVKWLVLPAPLIRELLHRHQV